MVLKQLIYLTALAREGHFGRAAEACNVSQPGLSTALRQLEEDLGVPIILRTQRFKGFTPQGELVLNFARKVLDEESTLRQQLEQGTAALAGRLKVGVVPSVMPMLPVLTGALCTRFPLVSIEALSLTEHDIQRKLLDLELDVGLTLLSTGLVPNIRATRVLYTENYTFLTPSDGPMSGRPLVTWEDVAGMPLALLKKNIRTREIIDRQFAAAGCSPTPQIETDSILSLCAHVGSGHWSTVLPRSYLHPFGPPRGTTAIPLPNSASTEEVGVVVYDRELLPPVLQAFLSITEEVEILHELRRLNDPADTAEPEAAGS
jgi:DNA-binding transcriptional LysR family regulator